MTKKSFLRLPPIISSGMVLQQGKQVCFWGWDRPGQSVRVEIADQLECTEADKSGKWTVYFKAKKAGGPYTIVIEGSEDRKVTDVYFGEVWVAGGQSNMELPLESTRDLFEEEIAHAHFPLIREFHVPMEYDFNGPLESAGQPSEWKPVTPENAPAMSALATFFAQKLHTDLDVPIGIIMTAVGGTPIEAWLPEEDLADKPGIMTELSSLREPKWVETIQRKDQKQIQEWYHRIATAERTLDAYEHWIEPAFDDANWESLTVPTTLKKTKLSGEAGSIWFRYTFDVPDPSAYERGGLLKLGAMIDYDEVWLNGVSIGSTEHRYLSRRYPVSSDILQASGNTLAIRLVIHGNNGGFVSGEGKFYGLECPTERIDFSGVWKAKRVTRVEPLTSMVFFQYAPTGLYNAMISPIKHYPIAGFLFYQGESNTGNPSGYSELMKRMINRWRSDWKDERLPFLYVQLTNYLDVLSEEDDRCWAALRLEQSLVEQEVPHTAMTVSIDAGEGNDLHPQDKKTLGFRMASDALNCAYEKAVTSGKPKLKMVTQEGDRLIILFDCPIKGKSQNNYLETQTVAKEWKSAEATINDNQIIVEVPKGAKISAVRYAYLNNPENPPFFSENGYPVGPFYEFL